MDTIVILSLISTVLFSTTRLVSCAPIGQDDPLQLTEGESEENEEDRLSAEQQDRIVTFLTLLEKAEKIASSRFAARITGVRAGSGNKLFGKKNRMDDNREDHSHPSLHQEESVDQTDELTDHNNMRGKHFRKGSQSLPRKAKKRACFWKYCIQNN